MSKFPAASKPLARPSNRLPDENSSDHGRSSSAGLPNRTKRGAMRRIVALPPWCCCLATLWASFQPPPSPWPGLPVRFQTKIRLIMAAIRLQVSCNRTKRRATRRIVALPPWRYCLTTLWASFQSPPSHWPSLPPDDFVFGAAGFVQESSQRSSNISWFDHVQFACASTQSKFETRFYEGKSLSSIMPSVSKVVKVSHSLCQECGLKVISQRYDLMSSKPSDTNSVPMSVRDAVVLERTLRSALESYNFQLRTMTALFRFSGDSGQIPLELWPLWRQRGQNLSSVTWCLPSRRLRSAICCQIPSSSRRIYLRLPLSTLLDMPQGMCTYIKEHSLGLPRRLGRLSGGPSLRLRHPGDALNLLLLLLRRSALKPPPLRSVLRSRSSRPIPWGGFWG